jgi:hypothetical protein
LAVTRTGCTVTGVVSHRWSRIASAIGAAVLVVGLAACGGGSSGDKADRTSPKTASESGTPTTGKAAAKKASAKKAAAAKAKAAGATTTVPKRSGGVVPTTAGGALVVPAVPTGSQITLPPNIGGSGKPEPEGSHSSPGTTVKPFDPGDGIDLSGTPGVTAAQQHAAEQLLRDSIRDLPAFASQSAAYAAGYRTIGDAITGDEHMINWAYANDDVIFDSKRPEALVYKIRPGQAPLLEAAMYLLRPTDRFANIPPLFRSPLTQFHVHTNLCFRNTADPLQKVVAGLTDSQGHCPAPTFQFPPVPMIHAWIVANPCGPFSALEGVGAGQTENNEPANCDTAHAGVL